MRFNLLNNVSIDKLLEFRDTHPKFRKAIDIISEMSDKFIVTYSVVAILIITIPVIAAYLALPEEMRKEVSGFLAGILSIIVIPVLLTQINKKNTSEQKRLEINYPLYKELSQKLIYLLKRDSFGEQEAKIIEIFLKDHYYEMCMSFSSNLIWNIRETYNECTKEVTSSENIRYYAQKCFHEIRKHLGINKNFKLSKSIMDLLQ